ncbi:MAG: hypothetical protein ACM3NQ_05790 [Bacteroidales bacterium]
MTHPLVLALFRDRRSAAEAAAAVRELGIDRGDLSVVCRSHHDEEILAREVGGTPGAEIEDSRPAARLGELGGQIVAAIALVLPGIGPIVAAGPLSADFGEAAGHLAGGIATVLGRAGLPEHLAAAWQRRVNDGDVVLGVHVRAAEAAAVAGALQQHGADDVEIAQWE